MPTVWELNGISILIYLPPREHGPAHVVVMYAGKKCEFWLATGRVKKNQGRFKAHRLLCFRRIVEENQSFLYEQWERYHGQED